nr:retrovirus-related Pol polyprotein from transposon TNT 1-94 [Tanacetum cinerariifolium]
MAFISLVKHSRGNDEVNTTSVYTASSNVPTASANVATVSISQETACAYIASQSSGSQIKFEDINQIDEDDMPEMDIKWNMALLSMRANKFWKKTGKKISIQGLDVARPPRNQDRGRRDNYKQGSKAEEQAPKALMAIDGVGWDWSYMENDEEDHALHNTYSIDLNNIVPHRDLTCLVAKAFTDECMIWHRRLEAVNTACYVQNRVLVNKAHNKTPYELFNGRTPATGFIKPFGCHVMILNTLDNL